MNKSRRIFACVDSDHVTVAGAFNRSIDRLYTIQLAGERVHLDRDDPRSPTWAAVIERNGADGAPLLFYVDDSSVVHSLLKPMLFRVVTLRAIDSRIEFEVYPSSKLRTLPLLNEESLRFKVALEGSLQDGSWLWITESLDGSTVLDIREGVPPVFDEKKRNFDAPLAPEGRIVESEYELTDLFLSLAARPQIPFRFPDDGCWARASEMCRILIAEGILTEKIWIYGKLRVETANSPVCEVRWNWHVAPTVRLDRGVNVEPFVIDPSIFERSVVVPEWISAQGDESVATAVTGPNIFHRTRDEVVELDPDYSRTFEQLAHYRDLFALRTAQFGPVPYANCR